MSMVLSKLNEMGPIGRGTGIRPLPHGEVAYGFIPGTEQIGVAAVCLAEKSFWYARTAEDIDPDTFAPIDIESPQLAATMAKTPDAMKATTAYISQQTGLKEIHDIL